jgi:tRNA wybutosine-synthesizing protein 3
MHLSRSKGVLLELSTGIWVSQLLRTVENPVIAEEDLGIIVNEYNRILLKGKKRLNRLHSSLKQIIPEELDPEVEKQVNEKLALMKNKTPLQVFYELAGISAEQAGQR